MTRRTRFETLTDNSSVVVMVMRIALNTAVNQIELLLLR
jgi:hypothetical protein